MNRPPATPSPQATGAILALTIIVGAMIGAAYSQPSIGLLVGAAIGIAVSIAAWLADRRRIGR